MIELEQKLKAARNVFEKHRRTVHKIENYLKRLSRTDNEEEQRSATVALKIAKTKVTDSEQKLKSLIKQFRNQSEIQNSNVSVLGISESSSQISERDHFSEALDRVDPSLRLQLAK